MRKVQCDMTFWRALHDAIAVTMVATFLPLALCVRFSGGRWASPWLGEGRLRSQMRAMQAGALALNVLSWLGLLVFQLTLATFDEMSWGGSPSEYRGAAPLPAYGMLDVTFIVLVVGGLVLSWTYAAEFWVAWSKRR
jgi:hypothetical protein